MSSLNVVDWINSTYYNSEGKVNSNFGSRKYCESRGVAEYHDFIMESTAWLDPLKPTFSTRVKAVLEGLQSMPTCVCGTTLKLNWDTSSKRTFNTFCSTKCAKNDESVKAKYEATCIERYGVTNTSLDEDIKLKIEENRQKLGIDDFKESVSKHYGDRFEVLRLDADRIELRCKIHDVEFKPFKADVRSGMTNCPKCRSDKLRGKLLHTHEQFEQALFKVKGGSVSIVSEYVGMHSEAVFACVEHGEFTTKPYQLIQGQICCPRCLTSTSRQEIELLNFVESLTNEPIMNGSRKLLGNGKEIDIAVGDVMIEYNGLYWHCDEFIPRNYHKDKTEAAERIGKRLYHIWCNEWKGEKRSIWESIIRNALGVSKKLGARKCEVVDVDHKTYMQFMDENHLQGGSVASIRLGLQHAGELVAVMSFGRPRYTDKYDYELIRFANVKGLSVVGGASKLFAAFIKSTPDADTVISYADRRISDGSLYKRLGFEFSHTTSPNYFYTKDFVNTLSRVACQKHKLGELLSDFNPELSEYENMRANKYYRVFDSGNSVWVYNRSKV